MNKRLKIDSLLIFLLLSIVTVVFFVGDINYFLPKSESKGVKTYVDISLVIDAPDQGQILKKEKLINYNSNFELYYSLDGGDSYKVYSNQYLIDLKPNDLTNQITSIREKKPFGNLPKVTSLLIKAKHNNKNIFTKPKQYTYYDTVNTTLPIVNLLVKEVDLFDEFKGIMNLGANSWSDKEFYKESWYRNANYNQRGPGWLKDVYFQYFESGKLKFDKKASIQISGHASRSFPQKSMKLKAIDENGKFDYHFFGEESLNKYSSLVLRNSGNDNAKTLFADLLMHNLIAKENVLSQKGKLVNVFLNGNYWGIYNLRERHNSYYIAKKENVKKKEVTVLEKGDGRLKSGNQIERKKYLYFIDSLISIGPNNENTYDFANNNISIKSFIDYILIETFYGNSDWLFNNTLWYKAKNKKWKWLIVDLDNALTYKGKSNIESNYFDLLNSSNTITARLFKVLIGNRKFNKKFKIRANSLMEKTFSNENIEKEFHTLKNDLNNNIELHLKRWRGKLTKETWELNCQNNLDFLINRKAIFLKQVNDL